MCRICSNGGYDPDYDEEEIIKETGTNKLYFTESDGDVRITTMINETVYSGEYTCDEGYDVDAEIKWFEKAQRDSGYEYHIDYRECKIFISNIEVTLLETGQSKIMEVFDDKIVKLQLTIDTLNEKLDRLLEKM